MIDALSAPRITLYNVRSAWAKWNSIAEDMDMRDSDISFLTEVWQKSESKKHQQAIEFMLEMTGIKYVSTPRPGVRRGGGTALACSQRRFVMSKLNVYIPSPLEACFALVKPKVPTGKVTKYICCSVYLPPKSKFSNKLSEFLVGTLNSLRSQHPGAKVIVGGDINDMKLSVLYSLDPTLKQIVKGFTNKQQTKTIDVLLMDCQDLYREPSILPPMTVDEGKVGVDSDHQGVEALPRTNLDSKGSKLREEVRVQPFPEAGLAKFGVKLMSEDWSWLDGCKQSSSDMVTRFETLTETMVKNQFPIKTVLVGPQDLPYFNEELRHLKRRRQRDYRKGKRSSQYIESKKRFEEKKIREATKYREKLVNEVKEGKRQSTYKAIRKLGNQPGEDSLRSIVLPAYVESGLSPQQCADRLADHFSAISMTVDPLDLEQFHPALRLALEEGKSYKGKPILSHHQVYTQMKHVTKPKSSVPGDIPRKLIQEFTYELAKPYF